MTKPILKIETLRKILRCDPDTGKLFWRDRTPDLFPYGKQTAEHRCRRWNSHFSGKEAFTADDGAGYRQGTIFDRKYRAHRVIWAMETGAWPDDQIDHIDQDRSNNRFPNLREATSKENCRNTSMRRDNKSGTTGVYWDKATQKWAVRVMIEGHNKNLGRFRCITAAIISRKVAEVRHGYHANHGRII